MTKTISKLFEMLKSVEVEITKKHQLCMINNNTSFKKIGKGKKGILKKNGKKVTPPMKKPKLDPILKLSASTSKGMVIGSVTAPNDSRIGRIAK